MKNLAIKTGISERLLGQIVGLLEKSGVRRAVLFGSRARGDYTDASDIDIAFWSEKDDVELWLALEQLPTIHKIDLVYFDAIANEAFRQNILHDAVLLVGS